MVRKEEEGKEEAEPTPLTKTPTWFLNPKKTDFAASERGSEETGMSEATVRASIEHYKPEQTMRVQLSIEGSRV